MSQTTTALMQRAMQWISQDPDQETRAELAELIDRAEKTDQAALTDLEERFAGHLTFGTAGLRAEIGAGPMRMNRVVVSHAAHGLGHFLLEKGQPSTPTVVVGFDARHKSDVFARDTAEVLQGLGINAVLLDQHTPTPVLAFAVRHLGADAGVMVTASHNPPADNGYKVYLGGDDGGSQIVPPADQMIHEAIMASHDTTRATALVRSSEYHTAGEDVIAAYIEATTRVVDGRSIAGRESLRICYTPMHGVGAAVFHRVLANTGFAAVIDVTEQVDPDPDFPTVAFPNPEEPGALDLAIETASREKADIIIAHDPDADRLAVAVPHPSDGGWHMLSGNDVGALLAWDITGHRSTPGGVLGCSLVSSPVLARIAEYRGYQSTVTPTGFKWISRLPDLVFGFEEALGYLVNPETVRDKDGISAGLLVAAIAAEYKAQGARLADVLGDLRDAVGGFASGQISLRFESPAIAQELMATVRARPEEVFPDLAVDSITDYEQGAGGFPPANIVQFDLVSGDRIIMRPSGTEPKLKVYLDSLRQHQPDADNALTELTATVQSSIDALTASG